MRLPPPHTPVGVSLARDGGTRYGGKGVEKAVDLVNREIFDAVGGMDAEDQVRIDRVMRTF